MFQIGIQVNYQLAGQCLLLQRTSWLAHSQEPKQAYLHLRDLCEERHFPKAVTDCQEPPASTQLPCGSFVRSRLKYVQLV